MCQQYTFLCKGGEDLRLDQRVQLVFGTMNRALLAHAPAASRGLGMSTYQVMPLSEHVGLIEWVDGTDTLKRLITGQANSDYERRVGKPYPKAGSEVESAAAKKYMQIYDPDGSADRYMGKNRTLSRKALTEQFESVSAGVPTDLLARAVSALSVSSEVYLSMRSQFARSLASLTACAHVLGIGDRHLDNFLLSKSTGRVVGIDFGHAFGSATYLLGVPELMGVRLTRQLTSFLRPLDTNVLLKGHMAVTLEALRARRSDLMRLMEVFLSEPIVDWDAQTRKLSAEQRAKLEADADAADGAPGQTQESSAGGVDGDARASLAGGASLAASRASSQANGGGRGTASATPRMHQPTSSVRSAAGGGGGAQLTRGWAALRLSVVDAKLRGGNAARLTLRDLESSPHSEMKKLENMKALTDIVLGAEGSLRRTLPSTGLTAAQQVDVLVEQATDPNVLGRTYHGWAPWL